ncbi:hypothetical protein IWW48_004418 [Coemansia sp. RSA 1200]|nr:hypothetical protein IWW48_004418 [Coemansia sp. RSA 1200]
MWKRISGSRVLHSNVANLGRILPQNILSATTATTTTPLRTASLKRFYHEDVVYGYRVPKTLEYTDYTPDQLRNRQAHSALVCFVNAYRSIGHRSTDLDPLKMQKKTAIPELNPARYGLTNESQSFNIDGILSISSSSQPRDAATMAEIHQALKETYSGHVAYEFEHIPDAAVRRWFADYVETASHETQVDDAFDRFMQKKFGQVKRYGLEGAESTIVALDELFSLCSHAGVTEAVLGMPHRGRLNILVDLLKYPPRALFHKLQGHAEFPEDLPASGDVISHIANSPSLNYGCKDNLHVTMLHNPSHLEAVNPVVSGYGRAKQMYLYDNSTDPNCALGDKLIGIQIHGDAAFTGQGVVMETLGLSNLPHFSLGGTIHLIVNNQIGYTTPATNARSTMYTSDIAKLVDAPVIHVNGDYPEEVARAMRVAFEYRRLFRRDVIVDLITFRRWGHNELDEPSFTQPLMYNIIRSRESIPKLYERRLKADHLKGKWAGLVMPKEAVTTIDTGVAKDTLREVGKKSVLVNDAFKVHPRLAKHHIQPRLQKLHENKPVDWATAEALAFGTLLKEGYNIRLCGQDVGRGTFSQRHAMFVCQESENVYIPLNNIGDGQGRIEVANSNLSELAVLGFEYGVSIQSPNILPIWEAQFGDFNNTAQVIIDTYITSGETKWLRQSGLVMLLPHGYDGAGPEHSSSRIERFLQMCNTPMDLSDPQTAQNPNIHVVVPTTPAQIFHLFRRQMKRNYRKPLVVAGPKTLLRLAAATSTLEDMAPGTSFRPVIPDSLASAPEKVKRIIFVSGKLYYDLAKAVAAEKGRLGDSIAVVRIEELCPFPSKLIENEIRRFVHATEFVWCQEETMNAGVYAFVQPRLQLLLPTGSHLKYIGRGPLAAPVTGVSNVYRAEQARIVEQALMGV